MLDMPLHDAFFHAASSFLAGVAIASATAPFASADSRILFVLGAIGVMGYVARNAGVPKIGIWGAIAAAGAAYQMAFSAAAYAHIPFNRKIAVEGIVIGVEHRLASQMFALDNGIRVIADPYPQFSYGDRIALEGVVRRPRSPLYAGNVNAYHMPIDLKGRHEGSPLKERLLRIRRTFEDAIKSVLPREKAAFLAGLTVGTTEEISEEFGEKLRASGTTHLVALSGANVMGLMNVALLALSLVLPRRRSFWPLVALVALFAVMTGAEPSLVRAAVMGIIFLAAERMERKKSFRNAITATALAMILWNPNMLIFDLGFQLSFAAMLGIAYLEPIIRKWSPWKNSHAVRAVAAQVAVTPVLALEVGRIAPWAIIPNILLAPVIPYAMALGFITGGAAQIHPVAAFAPALAANVCLAYAMAIIHIFAFGG